MKNNAGREAYIWKSMILIARKPGDLNSNEDSRT